MSVESLAIALHHSQASGTAKLVLIGIANHDGDGGAWPSVATLAHYAGTNARNTQKAISQLVSLGEIKREIQAGGDDRIPDHRKPNLYRFLLSCPHNCDRSRNHRTRHQQLFTDGVSDATPGVATDRGGVSDATPKPPLEPNHRDRALPTHVSKAPCGHKWMTDCEGRYCEFGHSAGGNAS